MTLEVKFRNQGTTNLSTEPRKRLVDYVRRYDLDSKVQGSPLTAFRHEGEWYFRASWLDGNILKLMVKKGFVERAWAYREPEGKRIISLYISERNTQINGRTTFYRVKDPEINNEISRASS